MSIPPCAPLEYTIKCSSLNQGLNGHLRPSAGGVYFFHYSIFSFFIYFFQNLLLGLYFSLDLKRGGGPYYNFFGFLFLK